MHDGKPQPSPQQQITVSAGKQYLHPRGNDDIHLPITFLRHPLETLCGPSEGYPTRSLIIAVNIVKAHLW